MIEMMNAVLMMTCHVTSSPANRITMITAQCNKWCRRYPSSILPSMSSFSEMATKKDRTRSFAMSGCGWLWPYYLGVIKTMKTHGYLTNKSTCAGTSGGSLGALVACADIEPELALEFIIKLSKSSHFFKDIDAGMKSELLPLLPSDALEKCNNRLDIVVTRLWPNPSFTKPLVTSSFQSKEELVDHIAASCFIPGMILLLRYAEHTYVLIQFVFVT